MIMSSSSSPALRVLENEQKHMHAGQITQTRIVTSSSFLNWKQHVEECQYAHVLDDVNKVFVRESCQRFYRLFNINLLHWGHQESASHRYTGMRARFEGVPKEPSGELSHR